MRDIYFINIYIEKPYYQQSGSVSVTIYQTRLLPVNMLMKHYFLHGKLKTDYSNKHHTSETGNISLY